MRFTELICRVAAARFADRAPLGVRLSPVALEIDEAGELVRVARERLPASTFVAVAAPGAPEHDDERTCTSSSERAAERATAWRNALTADDRILYVSVRRLGKAGGLEDTLLELTEADLREGVLSWCEEDARMPPDIVTALRAAGVVERVGARALCAFAAAASSARAGEIGHLLPLLDLAADSRLADGPASRLVANARWVRSAATGDNRGTGKLGAAALDVRSKLATAISAGDRGAGLRRVDLGVLTAEELNGDTTKASRQPRPSAATAPKPATNTKTATPPSKSGAAATGKAPRPAKVATPAPAASVPAAASPDDRHAHRPGDDAGDERQRPSADHLRAPDAAVSTPLEEGGGAVAPANAVAPHRQEDDKASLEDDPERTRPEVVPSTRTPRATRLGGVWTEAMHGEERGLDAPLPDGVRRLLAAVLAGDGDGLVWSVASDPGSIISTPPKALREPARQDVQLLDAEALAAVRAARAAVTGVLGGAMLDAVPRAPYSVLGDARVAPLCANLVNAWRALLDAAARSGAEALEAALALDTASVAALNGRAVVVLSPLHPVVLASLVDRLPGMERAAQARGAARSALAAATDTPISVPVRLPTRWGALPWRPSPRSAPIFGALAAPDPALEAAVAQTVVAVARLHPHAALGLTIAADAEPQAVARGVAEALAQDPSIRRAVVYAGEAIALSDAHEPLVTSGRLRVEPVDAAMRPHLWVRPAQDTVTAAMPPIALSWLDLPWRLAERGTVDLERVTPPRDASAWALCVGPRLRGAPRRPQLLLSRGSAGASSFAIVSSDPRGAARALTRTYKNLGVERITPRTIESLTRDLAAGAAGLVSLDEVGDGRVAALLLELAVGRALGEDAVVAGLNGDQLRVIMGVRGGAFCVGAAWTPSGVRIALGAGAISRCLSDVDAGALARGVEFVQLASGQGEVATAARRALVMALEAGWRRHEDGPRVLEQIVGGAPLTAQLLGVGPAGSMLRVGGHEVELLEPNARMLEELAVGLRS
jgi:hypothetical protein